MKRTVMPGPGTALCNATSVLSAYRLLVALLLLAMYSIELTDRLIGDQHPQLFLNTLIAYTTINSTLLLVFLNRRMNDSSGLLFATAIIDIIALSLLMQSSGAQSRPLSLLFVLAIIGPAAAMTSIMSTAIAAVATLSVLGQALLRIVRELAPIHELISAGSLGLVFFVTALSVQKLANRASSHEKLARHQAKDIQELQYLNEQIVHRMRTGIVVTDAAGGIKLINQSARQLLELPENTSALCRKLTPELADQLAGWREDPAQHTAMLRSSCGVSHIRASFAPLSRTEDSALILIFIEDTRAIEQQAQAMKLAALGRLTGSIAHEIRNPLGAISHAAQLLNESELLHPNDRRFSDIIRGQSKRVDQVIKNVLALSRREQVNPVTLDINAQLRAYIDTFTGQSRESVSIALEAGPDPLLVKFDPSQLDQVLTNLFTNGLRHSAERTGSATLTVKTELNAATGLPQLDIVDQGSGIRAEDLDRIFEPFFTTERSGTGLGLYLAREMCAANQTHLSYTEGQPSCFRMTFAHPAKKWLH